MTLTTGLIAMAEATATSIVAERQALTIERSSLVSGG
jgi:hypothetical protein